jgi:formate/nitrite transporter FocA (FNT family)
MRRYVGGALLLNGLLDIVGIVLRGTFVAPSKTTPAAFVHWASGSHYVPAYLIVIAGTALGTAGYFGFATILPQRIGRVGAVLAGLGSAFVMALLGVLLTLHGFATSGPLGSAEASAASVVNGSAGHTLEGLTALTIVGAILLAGAIWRSPDLPRWAGLPLVIAPFLLAFPFSLGSEITGAALLALAGLMVAGRPAARPASAGKPAADYASSAPSGG